MLLTPGINYQSWSTNRLVRLTQAYRGNPDLWCALACCALLSVAICLSWPFAESGFNDDWSYTRVALELAQSGRLHYNGWGSPTILFQTFWGAAWIRLLGFSFNVLRAATIPFALSFGLLLYALGRRVGLTPNLAMFGTMAVSTSPLFLPFAASFMTEIYTCFFLILCMYAAIASIESSKGRSVLWLWILTLSGILGGSNRQVVWAAPVALIPYVLWQKRCNRHFRLHAIAAYTLCLVVLIAIGIKFSQPYAPLELSRPQLIDLVFHRWFVASAILVNLGLSCLLVTLPALLCVVPLWRTMGASRLIASGSACSIATIFLILMFGQQHGLAPFLGNALSPVGILEPGQDALGPKSVVLPLVARVALTWLTLFSAVAFVQAFRVRRSSSISMPIRVFTLFSCAYIPLLVPGALVGYSYDRYMLPLFSLCVIAILRAFQSHIRVVPPSGWACLAVFGFYAMATTHDYFSALRARVLAAQTVERMGVSRSRISAGVEYDGWTQLQIAGTIRPVLYGDNLTCNASNKFWFWAKTSAVDPYYVVSYWPTSQLPKKRLIVISYPRWLPPFRSAVVVLKRTDLPSS